MPFHDMDLVIRHHSYVDAGKVLCATKLVKHIANMWDGEDIQTSPGVESPNINSHSQLAYFLTNKQDGSPIRAY